MSRTQQIAMLLEAAGPLTVATLRAALDINPYTLSTSLTRLCRWNVIERRNINGTRHYVMMQS